jgi:hypothetical protein
MPQVSKQRKKARFSPCYVVNNRTEIAHAADPREIIKAMALGGVLETAISARLVYARLSPA